MSSSTSKLAAFRQYWNQSEQGLTHDQIKTKALGPVISNEFTTLQRNVEHLTTLLWQRYHMGVQNSNELFKTLDQDNPIPDALDAVQSERNTYYLLEDYCNQLTTLLNDLKVTLSTDLGALTRLKQTLSSLRSELKNHPRPAKWVDWQQFYKKSQESGDAIARSTRDS